MCVRVCVGAEVACVLKLGRRAQHNHSTQHWHTQHNSNTTAGRRGTHADTGTRDTRADGLLDMFDLRRWVSTILPHATEAQAVYIKVTPTSIYSVSYIT